MLIDIEQRHERIASRHAIDAIHEVIDIHQAHTGNGQKQDDMRRSADKTRVVEHQQDGRKLADQPDLRVDVIHIIEETHCSQYRQADEAPREQRAMEQRP